MSDTVSSRGAIIVFLIVVAAIIGGSILLFSSRTPPTQITINPPLPTATSAPTNTPSPVLVYITGAVNQPNTEVTLPFGSRVSDAIEAAGGLTEDADLDRVNMVGLVRDGDQIHIFSMDEPAPEDDGSAIATPSGGQVIYINTATLDELVTLPGIGPATAQRILDYREENGAFASLADLDEVSGIGPATLETLEPLISFE